MRSRIRYERIDEEGKQYGRWKVLRSAGVTKHRAALFECECLCELHTRRLVRGYQLRNGSSQSCGCLQKELAAQRLASVQNYKESASPRTLKMWASGIRPRPCKDLTGQRFFRLFVLAFDHMDHGAAFYKVRCNCGTQKIVRGQQLTSGDTVSCGCYHSEVMSARFGELNPSFKHGHATLETMPTYEKWAWANQVRVRKTLGEIRND